MAISFNRYININSVVGAVPQVENRELIGRLFTTNPLLPTNSFMEFPNFTAVGAYFGTTSEEYARASKYFSFISKTGNAPTNISFARWADVNTAPEIFGVVANYSLGSFTSINNGAISITIGATTHIITGLNFTSALSLAEVASVIQVGINAQTGGIQWTDSAVLLDPVRKSFNFTGGDPSTPDTITAQLAGTGTEILNLIGWGAGAIFSNGILAQSITDVLTQSAQESNNFGSFLFMPVLTIDQYVEASQWEYAQNNTYMFTLPCTIANSSVWQPQLESYGGVGITVLQPGEFHEMDPMIILAATNYNQPNSVQNYMYQKFSEQTPTVSDDTTANTLDAISVNYYGNTQSAGNQIDFYQKGYLQGGSSDANDMNVFANEIWLKDAIGVSIMNYLLSIGKLSANQQGANQLLTVVQDPINQALFNGVISLSNPLTALQKLYIQNATGEQNAWYQVQNSGYFIKITISFQNPDWVANYILIYTKDNEIRKVNGTDILI